MSGNNPNTRDQRRNEQRGSWSSGRGRGGGEGGRGYQADLSFQERQRGPFGDDRENRYFGESYAGERFGREYEPQRWSNPSEQHSQHPDEGWRNHDHPRFGESTGRNDVRYSGEQRYGDRSQRHEDTYSARLRYAGAQQGRHSGLGPKGYTRSDDRIREDVCDTLTWDPDLDASDVTVSVSNGEVTLSGEVEDRPAKRHAEDIIEDIGGVKDVHNQLRARRGFFASIRDEVMGREEHGQREENNVGRGPKGSTTNPSAQYRS